MTRIQLLLATTAIILGAFSFTAQDGYEAISEATLSAATGTSPGRVDNGVLNCDLAQVEIKNAAVPPPNPSYVSDDMCKDVDSSVNPPVWKYQNHPCIECPVVAQSRSVGRPVNGYTGLVGPYTSIDCGTGPDPQAMGNTGTCVDGVCTNKQPYACSERLGFYLVQDSGPGEL